MEAVFVTCPPRIIYLTEAVRYYLPASVKIFENKKKFIWIILNLNLKINLKIHTNQKTLIRRVNIYITSIHVSSIHIVFHYKFIANASSHDDKIRGPSRGVPATCSRSCRGRFSNCVASCTSPLSLARSWHWRIFHQHDNIHRWQIYKCRILFEWWLNDPPLSFATML